MSEDVDALLECMAGLVRAGDRAGAAALGNDARRGVPLAVAPCDLALGGALARGAESTVLCATFRGRDAVFKRAAIRDAAALVRFRAELAVLARLRHAHVAPLLAARAVPPDYGIVLPRYTCSLHVRSRPATHRRGRLIWGRGAGCTRAARASPPPPRAMMRWPRGLGADRDHDPRDERNHPMDPSELLCF